MTIREKQEEMEKKYLSPYATLSSASKGREVYEEPCDIRPVFQRDRDRIIHSKAFRRLKHKTQVFLSPEGDHYRTRLTHTLEVSQIARTIAKALLLNEDLTEAIALGHDLGHTPFGHAGEFALNSVCQKGFEHSRQSIRVVERLENKGQGLNLTWEVRDGILNHQTKGSPSTLEGKVVRFSDKIAYINHDIDDAIRGGILLDSDIPKEYTNVLGASTKERLDCMIHDIINNSENKNEIKMSADVFAAMQNLRKFMFNNVYFNSKAKSEEVKAKRLLIELYNYYKANINMLPEEYREMIANNEISDVVVCDYVSGMTDNYSIMKFQQIFEPRAWNV